MFFENNSEDEEYENPLNTLNNTFCKFQEYLSDNNKNVKPSKQNSSVERDFAK